MADSPLLIVLLTGGGLYFAKLWWDDLRAARTGAPGPAPLPGAVPCSRRAVVIAVGGAGLILAAETGGEIFLGISAEQTEISLLFGLYTLVAAVIEEIIFRGYLILPGRARPAQWLAVIGASLVFAALHDFLWHWEDGALTWDFSRKGIFSTAAVFVSSLWFYTVRLLPANPDRSLLPCFAAHAAKNLGVLVIKGAQGFVTSWW